VTVEEAVAAPATAGLPRYDDPNDPLPPGGVALVEWWRRHRFPGPDAAALERVAQGAEYGLHAEPNDDA
jgi:hypothetical protein